MNNKEFLVIVVITAVVIGIWIFADIFHVMSTKTSLSNDPKISAMIQPIDPTFDQKTINQITDLTANDNTFASSSATITTPTPTPVTQPQTKSSATPSAKVR